MPQIATVGFVGGFREGGAIGAQEEPAGLLRKLKAWRVLRYSFPVDRGVRREDILLIGTTKGAKSWLYHLAYEPSQHQSAKMNKADGHLEFQSAADPLSLLSALQFQVSTFQRFSVSALCSVSAAAGEVISVRYRTEWYRRQLAKGFTGCAGSNC